MIKLEVLMSDGLSAKLRSRVEPVVHPDGWIVYSNDGQMPARVRHDKVSRTLGDKITLIQTNETVVGRPIIDGEVDWRSKEVTRLDRDWDWVIKFRDMLGELVWGLYVQPGFGFQDTNSKPTDPDVGPFKQQSLTCGGNLVNVIGDPMWTAAGEYRQVQVQSFYSKNYFLSDWNFMPHLFTKQVLVGHNADKETYYIAHQKHGDLTWPWVCDRPLAISSSELEFLPKLPFATMLDGIPVMIDAYCFHGSNTYGRINDRWYLLEEMVVSGIGSCTYDRRVYVKDWVETCPPPVKGWIRTERSTLLEWTKKKLSKLGQYISSGLEWISSLLKRAKD